MKWAGMLQRGSDAETAEEPPWRRAQRIPPSGNLNPGDLSVSGQRETANGFTVNGSSAQEAFNMFAAVVPNLDSIEEFRVLTSNFDAEYGNFSGAQVVVTTKSGGNQVRGSAFGFLRNMSLSAGRRCAGEQETTSGRGRQVSKMVFRVGMIGCGPGKD